jgi:hypothetical protein
MSEDKDEVLYRCRICGMRCRDGRDALDVSTSRLHELPVETVTVSFRTSDGVSGGLTQTITTGTFKMPVVKTGCPFCGSPNWKK